MRCDACGAVEAALTPRSGRVVEAPERTVSFPLLAPEREAPARHRAALWVGRGAGLIALVTGVLYAWRTLVR